MTNEKKVSKRIPSLPNASAGLLDRAAALSQIIRTMEANVPLPDAGPAVRVKKHRDGFQYYIRENGEDRYIPSAERDTLRPLFQAEYDRKLVSSAKRELQFLQKYLTLCKDAGAETVYAKMPEGKKPLIRPLIPTDEEYLKAWDNMKYDKKPFTDNNAEHKTEKGERVRSKSEELIANALLSEGIPYHYEMPFQPSRQCTIHPDFTLLDMSTRTIIYWEHLGIMDDREYARNAVRRIRDYAAAGIFPGDKLILTFETAACPLTTADIKETIRHYLKKSRA